MYVCNITSLYVKEVHRGTHFFQEYMEKTDNFVIHVVLPEVIGCWFTRREQTVNAIDVQSTNAPLKEVSNTISNELPAPAHILYLQEAR